jgi:hypothetical protein
LCVIDPACIFPTGMLGGGGAQLLRCTAAYGICSQSDVACNISCTGPGSSCLADSFGQCPVAGLSAANANHVCKSNTSCFQGDSTCASLCDASQACMAAPWSAPPAGGNPCLSISSSGGSTPAARYSCVDRQSLCFYDTTCSSPQTNGGGGYTGSLCAAGTVCVNIGYAGACAANNATYNSGARYACLPASSLCYSTPQCNDQCTGNAVCAIDILHDACVPLNNQPGGGGGGGDASGSPQPSGLSGRNVIVAPPAPQGSAGGACPAGACPAAPLQFGPGPPQMQQQQQQQQQQQPMQQFIWSCVGPAGCFAPSDEAACRAACFGEACQPEPLAAACGSPNASLVLTGNAFRSRWTGAEGWAWICPYTGPLDHPLGSRYIIDVATSLPLLGCLLLALAWHAGLFGRRLGKRAAVAG